MMRIDLNPLAPMATAPSTAVLPVSELTGGMALAMAAAELAANAGQTGSQQSDAQSHAQSQSQSQAQTQALLQKSAPSVTASSAAVVRAVALAAHETPIVVPAALSPSADRLTLSREAALFNPVSLPRTEALTPTTLARTMTASPSAAPALTMAHSAPAAAVVPPTLTALASKPPAQFLMQVIESLSGEPASEFRLLDLRTASSGVDMAYGPAAVAGRPTTPMSLLLQGNLRSVDGQSLPFTFAATIARGQVDASWMPALTALLNAPQLTLDYPGPATDLAGQTLHFQMALDPRNLWPLQSFLLSGLLTLGKARRGELGDDEWEWVWEDEDSPHDGLPQKRRRKLKPPKHDPVSELPEDGGPPLISGARWLELELRHLRSELRAWMGLPEAAV